MTDLNEKIAASRRNGVVFDAPEPGEYDLDAFRLPGGLLMSRNARGKWSVAWLEQNGPTTSRYGADVPRVLIPLLREMVEGAS